ncbi:DUF4836 family protein [uncultured Bacteroides sp.]|uniref:DUF4836 family protein n=1 Tax=uncultured Bacteroides sp. TaxID=162156 RepID=UPI002AAA66EE|nr:DUF4836 family protein [uncultured Bacteroides sp.]
MNKLKFFSHLSVLLVAVLLLGSCSKDREYTRVIPSNASLVVSVDVPSIIKKSGLMDNKESIMKNMSAALNNEKLAKLVQNPSEAGLSLEEKAYFFLSSEDAPVVLFKVSDMDKLQETFKLMQTEGLCDEIEKNGSYSSAVLRGFGICAFDNSSLIIMETTNPHSLPVKESVTKLMNQDEKVSITANKGFQQMIAKKSDVCLYGSFASMPQLTSASMMMGLPEDADLREMMLLAQMNFENGKVAIEGEYYTENKSLKEYFKKQSEMGGKINHAFLKRMPASSLAYLCTNVKGDKLYEMLIKSTEFKGMVKDSRLTPGFNMKNSVTSLNGDVSVALSGMSENGTPLLLAYAEVKDPSAAGIVYAFKKDFDEVGMTVATSGKNEYVVKSPMLPMAIHFGVRNNYFYLTNDENLYKSIGKDFSSSLADAKYEYIKGDANGYFVLDMDNVMKLPMVTNAFARFGSQGAMAQSVLAGFSYAEAYNKDDQKSVVNIYLKNKNENVLKQLIAGLRKVIG